MIEKNMGGIAIALVDKIVVPTHKGHVPLPNHLNFGKFALISDLAPDWHTLTRPTE